MATSASKQADPEMESTPQLAQWFPTQARVRTAVLGVLFLALNADILYRLSIFARTDGDWSHAMLVPFFSLYFIYQHRGAIARTETRPCWAGLAIMIAAMGVYSWAMLAGNDMLKGYAMIGQLMGLALLLVGPGVMRWLWFPILYLAFGVKVNESVWAALAWQLQLIAAHGAVYTLNAFGMDAVVTTTTLEFWNGAEKLTELTVAEACSGMRMLMTFVALGVAVAYGWDRPTWARLVMIALTVPIALLVNILRVTALGVLSLVDPDFIKGDFHIFLGMLMLVPALGLFFVVGWILDQLTEDTTPIPPSASDESPTTESIADPSPSESTTSEAESASILTGPFVAGAILMLIGIGTLVGYTNSQGIHWIKDAASPRRGLYLMPDELGPFHKRADIHLPHAMIEELGTERFINWLVEGNPDSGLMYQINVAYYTGLPDANPHITNRSYTAGGVDIERPQTAKLSLQGGPLHVAGEGQMQATVEGVGLIHLPQTIELTVADVVAVHKKTSQKMITFYIANGIFVATAHEASKRVTDRQIKRMYWCKVEVLPLRIDGGISRGMTDKASTLEAVSDLLPYLLPEVVACLPEAK